MAALSSLVSSNQTPSGSWKLFKKTQPRDLSACDFHIYIGKQQFVQGTLGPASSYSQEEGGHYLRNRTRKWTQRGRSGCSLGSFSQGQSVSFQLPSRSKVSMMCG